MVSLREITPLRDYDCFLVFDRTRNDFNFHTHFHPEYEINFIKNAAGGKRIVGNHSAEIEDYELVMIGPNISHGWENYKNDTSKILHEITIQFPKDLFDRFLLNKNILKPINKLLKDSESGILFSKNTAINVEARLSSLARKTGFENFIEFQLLLNDLAKSENKVKLTNNLINLENNQNTNKKVHLVYDFIKNNYSSKIMINDVATTLNMTVISFGRFLKKHTNKTFTEIVNEYRLGYASRKLIETNESVSEICFTCGFNNISNFNRRFKAKHGCTPTKYRTNFNGVKNVI